jgi:lysophospholipase L1-like esterase
MMRRRVALVVASVSLTVGTLIAAGTAPAAAATSPLPSRIVAVGDSITTATDVAWCCVNPNGGNPQFSWSTGTENAVNSHYLRVLGLNGGAPVATLNVAQPGADSGDLAGQLGQATAFGPDYVTVLMGGNDLCWNPTPKGVFRQRVKSAFAQFFSNPTNARMFVSSIPNLYQLWSILRDDPRARLTWTVFDICPEMLGNGVTESQRQQLLDLEQTFNGILASTCAQYVNCKWDNNATFNYQFTPADISTVDYFHPSVTGQCDLAAVTWNASYWGPGSAVCPNQ